MFPLRDSFRVSVSKSMVNGFGTSVECVDGSTNHELVASSVSSCWLQVNCMCNVGVSEGTIREE